MNTDADFYGKLHKTYEVWCKCCGQDEYLLSNYHASEKWLRKNGWKKINGFWYCERCVEKKRGN